MRSIRGATTVETNDRQAILSATGEMLAAIFERNGVAADDVISIQFTATSDLTAAYPAEAARQLGVTRAGLCCYQEMRVDGSLPMCVRALVYVESEKPQRDMEHVYLRGAVGLRSDLINHVSNAIAIDGPGGSGKSTAAKNVAKKLQPTAFLS